MVLILALSGPRDCASTTYEFRAPGMVEPAPGTEVLVDTPLQSLLSWRLLLNTATTGDELYYAVANCSWGIRITADRSTAGTGAKSRHDFPWLQIETCLCTGWCTSYGASPYIALVLPFCQPRLRVCTHQL